MSRTAEETAGLKMLEISFRESQAGFNVLVHSEGTPPLPLRSFDLIRNNPTCVAIHCWAVEGHVSGCWVVRLSSIRSIELPDRLPSETIEMEDTSEPEMELLQDHPTSLSLTTRC